jgi:predicted nucleic acid-binding protein
MPPILVDTGPLYAMADRDDDWHLRVVRFLKRSRDELVVPEQALVRSVANGEMTLEALTLPDLRRTLDLLSRYTAARIGFVDAAVVATAERLQISRILTTDRRDFSLIRPRHCRAFELLP